MIERIEVEWTNRSLRNAEKIRKYLEIKFSQNEVKDFENLLKEFQKNISVFPKLYPQSKKYLNLRRAVLHKYTSVFYSIQLKMTKLLSLQYKTTDKRKQENNKSSQDFTECLKH